jgi:anti-sigma regulatory factor (Ser/Thr protein kinase)
VTTALDLAQTNRQQQAVLQYLADAEIHFVLPSNLSLVSPMVGFLQNYLKQIGVSTGVSTGEGDLRLPIAVHEGLVNAITHGNLNAPGHLRETDYAAWLRCIEERQSTPMYGDRRVHVLARKTPEELIVVIRDEGAGFDTTALPDPTDTEALKKATGRGLFLIRTFMDEVHFNSTGNEIIMIKRR